MLAGTESQKNPKADPNKTVKCYTRSAAGLDLTVRENLRPFPVLFDTLRYLLTTIIENDRFHYKVTYDFICDRIRSINQDIIVQNLCAENCIKIYEPVINFYVYSTYRLCEESANNFDSVMSKKQLLEYLKRLLVCYDEIESKKEKTDLTQQLEKLSVEKRDGETDLFSPNRSLVESIYLLLNLKDNHAINRYFYIPVKYKNDILRAAFQISLNAINGNYVRTLKILPSTPILLQCIMITHLPSIRRFSLNVMSVAFSSKNLTYPLKSLCSLLSYESETDAARDCMHYGIRVENDQVQFRKDDFNNNDVQPIRRNNFLDDKFKSIKPCNIVMNGNQN